MKNFPDINEIKLLEKNSQKNGSGIVHKELLGIWNFKYVWGKDNIGRHDLLLQKYYFNVNSFNFRIALGQYFSVLAQLSILL